MTIPRIIVNNLSFHIELTAVSFNDISMSFEALKYGIVGDNGVGKTTLLKLLSGELAPEKGSIQCSGSISLIPQSHVNFSQMTIREVLGISEITSALDRINRGDYLENDFEIVADNWDLAGRIETALRSFTLWPIDLDKLFTALSGGQKTKILLAKTLIFPTDFIFFDEPTNNLDQHSRDILYGYIESCPKGIIVVSHDRTLLNKMDRIIEITTKGIQIFGGNYDFYHQQKELELQALQQAHTTALLSIKQTARSIQGTREKHERLAGRGKKAFRQGKVDKLTARSKKGRSEKTKSRMAGQEERLIASKQSDLASIKEKIEN